MGTTDRILNFIFNASMTFTINNSGSDCLVGNTSLTLNDGKLGLGAGVREKIGRLVLGAVTQTNGTYGSTSSEAENKNNTYFQGTGVLYAGIDIPPLPAAGMIILIQ